MEEPSYTDAPRSTLHVPSPPPDVTQPIPPQLLMFLHPLLVKAGDASRGGVALDCIFGEGPASVVMVPRAQVREVAAQMVKSLERFEAEDACAKSKIQNPKSEIGSEGDHR